MRRVVILITVGIVLTAATSWSQSCCKPQARCVPLPGPEVSGNYAIPYLYSQDHGQYYADPMYYYAFGTLDRWHKIRPWQGTARSATRKSVAKQRKTYEQVEK